jgi:hypothetical protein
MRSICVFCEKNELLLCRVIEDGMIQFLVDLFYESSNESSRCSIKILENLDSNDRLKLRTNAALLFLSIAECAVISNPASKPRSLFCQNLLRFSAKFPRVIPEALLSSRYFASQNVNISLVETVLDWIVCLSRFSNPSLNQRLFGKLDINSHSWLLNTLFEIASFDYISNALISNEQQMSNIQMMFTYALGFQAFAKDFGSFSGKDRVLLFLFRRFRSMDLLRSEEKLLHRLEGIPELRAILQQMRGRKVARNGPTQK